MATFEPTDTMTLDEKVELGMAIAMQKPTMELWILDSDGNKILFTYVQTIAEGRAMWRYVGAHGSDLYGFEIIQNATVVYRGSYVTDEC